MTERRETTDRNGRGPLRILIFTKCFYPSTGGVETRVALFAKELFEAGCEPIVVTETAAASFDDRQLSYPVIRRPGLAQFWRLIGDTDLLHLAGPPFLPLLLALLRRKPIVIEHHNYQPVCPNGLLLYEPDQRVCPGHFMAGKYGKCLGCGATSRGWLSSLRSLAVTFPRRWMCKRVSANVAITRHVASRLQLPRSQVVYLGLPDPLSQNQVPSPTLSLPLRFAYVGRLVAEKGLPDLVEAASRLWKRGYDFRLIFIGDGPQRALLEEMADERGLTGLMTITGFLSGEAFRETTQEVAVVVMPSVWEETGGLAAMEQMFRGRLVIASDIGGLGEIVDGAGLKFTAGDVSQLAACMQRVLDQPEIAKEMGQRARRRSLELFAGDQQAHAYLNLYDVLVR